jgi:hypothetical protein
LTIELPRSGGELSCPPIAEVPFSPFVVMYMLLQHKDIASDCGWYVMSQTGQSVKYLSFRTLIMFEVWMLYGLSEYRPRRWRVSYGYDSDNGTHRDCCYCSPVLYISS